jgi:hypothetical protein
LADIADALPNVRFTPEERTSPKTVGMSALCHKATSSRRLTELKNDAASEARVPAVTNAANHGGWYYNNRCSRCYNNPCSRRYNNRCSRCYNNRCTRCYDNRRRGCDYDWTSIRATSSVRTRMKARTTSARSAGTVNIDE